MNMKTIIDVNAHLHTPYSFSAFKDVRQALDMAAAEGVEVVGINDFYSLDGYREWNDECAARHLYPMFNIEFISLNSEDQWYLDLHLWQPRYYRPQPDHHQTYQ